MLIRKLLLSAIVLASCSSFATSMTYSLNKKNDPNGYEGGTTPDCPLKKNSAINNGSVVRVAKKEKEETHTTSYGRVAH